MSVLMVTFGEYNLKNLKAENADISKLQVKNRHEIWFIGFGKDACVGRFNKTEATGDFQFENWSIFTINSNKLFRIAFKGWNFFLFCFLSFIYYNNHYTHSMWRIGRNNIQLFIRSSMSCIPFSQITQKKCFQQLINSSSLV